MKNLFITFFFVPIIPIGYVLEIIGISLFYWSEKVFSIIKVLAHEAIDRQKTAFSQTVSINNRINWVLPLYLLFQPPVVPIRDIGPIHRNSVDWNNNFSDNHRVSSLKSDWLHLRRESTWWDHYLHGSLGPISKRLQVPEPHHKIQLQLHPPYSEPSLGAASWTEEQFKIKLQLRECANLQNQILWCEGQNRESHSATSAER